MRHLYLLAALMPALAAFPEQAAPAVEPARAAPAPAWTMDKARSRLAFVAAMNGQAINGLFRNFDAQIRFDPANLAGSRVEAVIDTGSAATGDAARDQSLPAPDWFNTRVFPRAQFKASRFTPAGPGRYLATGMLTIRGNSRPVTLPFQVAINDKVAMMRGSLTIDRRAFGVGQGQFAGTEPVAANVRVDIAIAARR